MRILLALLGATLVAVGIIWRWKEIQAGTMAGTPDGTPGRKRRIKLRRSSASKSKARAANAVGADGAEAKALRAHAPSAVAQGRRRSDRVLLKIPLEVSGIDVEGNAFTERSFTLVINRNGASLVLRNPIRAQDEITIKNLQSGQSCKFRACVATQDFPGGVREWGVECVDPAPRFWGISFPDEPAVKEKIVGSLLECSVCHSREMTHLTMSEYRATVERNSAVRLCSQCGKATEWVFTAVEEDFGATGLPHLKEPAAGVPAAARVEQEREDRRIARLPMSIRHEDGREEFTITENVSRSGVCCAANMELEAGDRVFVWLVSDEGSGEAEFRAQIMWRRKIHEKRGILYGMKLERENSPAA